MFRSPTMLCVFVALILFLQGCSPSRPADVVSAEFTSWTVEIKTTGGFAGRGKGNVSISSEGKAIATRPDNRGELGRPCEGKLDAAGLRIVSDAVKRSSPSGWKVPGLDIAAPDAFGYTLELQTENAAGKQTYKIEWYDNTENKLPGDAKRLIEAVFSSMSQATKNCP